MVAAHVALLVHRVVAVAAGHHVVIQLVVLLVLLIHLSIRLAVNQVSLPALQLSDTRDERQAGHGHLARLLRRVDRHALHAVKDVVASRSRVPLALLVHGRLQARGRHVAVERCAPARAQLLHLELARDAAHHGPKLLHAAHRGHAEVLQLLLLATELLALDRLGRATVGVQHVRLVVGVKLQHDVLDDVRDADGVLERVPPPAGCGRTAQLVLRVRECEQHAHRRKEHLHAHQPVHDGLGVLLIPAKARGQEGDQQALPEGQENDCLEHKELHERLEGVQQLLTAHVEQQHPEQRHRIAHVVDERNVAIAVIPAVRAHVVLANHEEEEREEGKEGLGDHKLQGALLAVAQEEAIHWHGLQAAVAQQPRLLDDLALALDHHCTRPSHVGEAQRHEVVDDPCLIAISRSLKVQRMFAVLQCQP
mmetsp:Transcript_18411/g.46561  ORF Transcript_18411/g.46561 Transcript_18411/m.46561 type:complete len:422 (+) Transcript_18411:1138-2403(+)